MQKDAHVCVSGLGFPMERDSATLRDKETEVSSLSQDKGHQDKLKILPWDGTGQRTGQSLVFWKNLGRKAGWDGTITIFFL